MNVAGGVRSRLVAVLAIVASALLYALYSRATWPWVALGWIGLVPFLLVLDRIATMRAAWLAGLAMAVAFELAVFGWFAWAIADYAEVTPLVPLLALTGASPLLQPQLVTVALARVWFRRARPDAIATVVVLTAATYVATESIAPKLFGDTLGYPLYGSLWWRQGADVAGVPGLTLVMVAVNELVAAAVRTRRTGTRAPLAALATAVAFVAVLAAYGAWRCAGLDARAGGREVAIGLVQADLGHYDRMAAEIGRYETVRAILDTHMELSAPLLARNVAVLLWPETVYPTTFGKPKSETGAAFDREIAAYVARAGVPLVFGAYDTDGAAEFNAAFFLAPDAATPTPFAIYRKTRLFPLTERVPAMLDAPWLRRLLPWLGTWSEGAGASVVTVPVRDGAVHVAPLICYDVLDPTIARAAASAGADVIVTLSNDSWFAFGAGPELHLQGAAFRSIETRRPQVRATNTGISAVIDATGRVVARLGVDERGTLVGSVHPDGATNTLVMRFGQWVEPCAWIALLLVGGLRVFSRGF